MSKMSQANAEDTMREGIQDIAIAVPLRYHKNIDFALMMSTDSEEVHRRYHWAYIAVDEQPNGDRKINMTQQDWCTIAKVVFAFHLHCHCDMTMMGDDFLSAATMIARSL